MTTAFFQFFKKNKKIFFSISLVLLIALFTGRTLFSNKLARTDDLELHAVRVSNYYLALKQGQFPPYWGPNLYYGFGYPIFLFSYHTPYLISSIFYIAGFSIESSINLLLLITLIIGSIGYFLFSYQQNKKYLLAISTSLIYLSAPYILLNYFVRGALGEITFISLIPWVFWLINISDNSKKWWYQLLAILIFTSLILSHPLSLLILTPIVISYLILKGVKKFHYSFYLTGLISILLTSFSWFPMLLEKKYTIIATHSITNNFVKYFPDLKSLFYSKWGYGGANTLVSNDVLPTTFGFSVLLIVLVSIGFIISNLNKKSYKNKIRFIKKYKFMTFWLIIFLINFFLMTIQSKQTWIFSKILPYIQYPWRLLWVGVISSIMIYNSRLFVEKLNKNLYFFILSFIFLGSIFNLVKMAKPLSYISNSDYAWREHPTTSTSDNELKPIWFNENQNIALDKQLYLKNYENEITPISPNNIFWSGSKMTYQIDSKQDTNVLQKTAYFPGWEVKVNKVKTPINYQDKQFEGRITYPIKKGLNNIEVQFTNNTFARKIGLHLSFLGSTLWLISIGIFFIKKNR